MPKSNRLIACLAICLVSLLVACSPQPGKPNTAPADPSPDSIQQAANQQEDTFKVVAWVDNPNPRQGEIVNLSGSLIKNGVYLGGMMMHAMWPDKDQERGVPNCKVLVIYQRGVCIIKTDDFASGELVPVTVKFVYNDQTYSGETGFTVK